MRLHSSLLLLPAFAASLLLTGCSSTFDTAASGGSPASSGSISGVAWGGRQPISGARVYLLQASTTTYAGPGISASSGNKSTSLLTSGDGSDGIGFYVNTSSSGAFSFTGHTTPCTSGDQVYIYSLGGKPDGTNANSAAALMAILGTCGTDFNSGTTVNMNEVSTVAAAYAMSGFATDPTHVGTTGSALAQTGIRNAFANAKQLFDISSNPYTTPNTVARTATFYSGTNGMTGTVPQQQVNTLADMLATCVNSSSSGSTQCTTLFGSSGATDTAAAAIAMAHKPYDTSVYNVGPTPPYNPYYSTAPNDLTIVLTFSGGGLSDPWNVNIDANGSAWFANYGTETVTELSALGNALTGSGGYGTSISGPNGVAIDTSGNAWVVNNLTSSVTKLTVNSSGTVTASNNYTGSGMFDGGAIAIDGSGNVWTVNFASDGTHQLAGITSSGGPIAGSSFNGNGVSYALAIDPSNNIWTGEYSSNTVARYTNTGARVSPVGGYTGSGLSGPYGIAIDNSGSSWTINYTGSTVTKITSGGTVSGPYGSGSGISGPYGISIDGAGNLWVASYDTPRLSELNNSGTAITPSTGYPSTMNKPFSLAVDGSGNVWIANYGNNNALEYIGVAVPVATPAVYGVINSKLGARP